MGATMAAFDPGRLRLEIGQIFTTAAFIFRLLSALAMHSVHDVAQTGFGDGTNELYDRLCTTMPVYEITHALSSGPVLRTLRMLSSSSVTRSPLLVLSTSSSIATIPSVLP